jgi:hypothetical protein
MDKVRESLDYSKNRIDRARGALNFEELLRAVEWLHHAITEVANYVEGQTKQEGEEASGDDDLLDV